MPLGEALLTLLRERVGPERMRPTWDLAADRMVEYIRARTGVTVPVPQAV